MASLHQHYRHLKNNRMKKIALLFTTFSLVCLSAKAQFKTNLDTDWRFHLGHASNPEKDFNYSIATLFSKSGGAAKTAIDPKFVDTTWTKVTIPHDWAVDLPFVYSPNFDVESHGYKPIGGLYPETSIGWYRKHFSVSPKSGMDRYELQFDGIFRNASIWLNGFYVGTNQSGYVCVSYDVTDYIQTDKENILVVRVDATQYEGWFYEGAGIYRHVWLNQFNNLHVADGDFYVYADVKGNKATVHLETTVQNKNFSPSSCTVSTFLKNREGKIIGKSSEQSLRLATNQLGTVKQQITINNCIRWDIDQPYLYRAVTVVKQNGTIVDQQETKFGVRTFAFDSQKGFFLNGKPLKIKGTNNHQDHAGVGSALPDDLQYYRIKLLKELGSNAYRASHNAPTRELLEACDSLGMLVLDEQRLLNSSPEYMDQFTRLIKRDRNHASVFLWSIGNEEGWIQKNEFGKKIALTLLAKQRELDPSRTSTYAADMGNEFGGVNEVIPVRGFNYRQFAVADYHKDHPNQPLLGTEMGSTVTTRGIYEKDPIRAYVPDQDITAPWWASKAEEWWSLAAVNDYWMGGFVWTGLDYRGEPTPYKWPNINSHFGIMDVCGFPKNIYYYYKSWWTNEDVIHISPHWNWPDKIGQPIEVWVNTNADDVELFLNGKSLGKKVMPRHSHLKWSVPYEPGKLEAVGFKKGKKITTSIETTGTPYRVIASPNRTTLKANGTDAVIVNLSIVDEKGREVPVADNRIQFQLSGDAKIIGVGNGDPSSHEPDHCPDGAWQRNAFNGKCQVILQAGKTSGMVTLKASANGLTSETITLTQTN
jgi:beta-galactosidase